MRANVTVVIRGNEREEIPITLWESPTLCYSAVARVQRKNPGLLMA
jgi:hypothetical protein